MDYEGIEANYIAGTPYLGADVKMYPGPGGYQGELVAWDVAHAKKAWGVKDAVLPVYSGVLATGGDVVFYGTMEGWFVALDARTGTELWKFHTASGIVGNPITYLGPGRQAVRRDLLRRRRLDGRGRVPDHLRRRSVRRRSAWSAR